MRRRQIGMLNGCFHVRIIAHRQTETLITRDVTNVTFQVLDSPHSENRNEVLYPVSGILGNALRNPCDTPDLLLF